MNEKLLLTLTSLLSLLLLSIHVTDDIVRGYDRWGFDKLSFVAMLVVWLIGTLLVPHRRSGRIIMLLGGFLAGAMPAIHMRGTGAFVKTPGAFFFIWTLFALGALGTMTFILAIRALATGAAHEQDRRSVAAVPVE